MSSFHQVVIILSLREVRKNMQSLYRDILKKTDDTTTSDNQEIVPGTLPLY